MKLEFPEEYRILATMTAMLFALGTFMYHLLEKFSWLDSLYLSVITLATVGYGDIVPVTPAGKIFTIFYVLFGIGVLVNFASVVAKRRFERRAESHGHRTSQ